MKPINRASIRKAQAFLVKTIAGIIILSVVANLFTDLLKGTTSFLLNAILQILTLLFRSYVETIHSEIGEARSDGLLKTLYVVVFVFGFYALFRFPRGLILQSRRYEQERENYQEQVEVCKSEMKRLAESGGDVPVTEDGSKTTTELLKERIEHLLNVAELSNRSAVSYKRDAFELLTGIFLILLWVFGGLIGNAYTRSASTFVERSIEILAPTIPPEKVLQLRAEYRSVDSARKFYELHDVLQTIAKEKNVTLPKFTVIKR